MDRSRKLNERAALKATAAKKKSKTLTADQKLVAALGHRLRVECLQVFSERSASPNELTEILGQPLSNLSHHVKVLKELGFIELVNETPRRGAVEHYYRATARPFIDDESWAKMTPKDRLEISTLVGGSIFGRYLRALGAGTISDRDDSHLSWRHMRVDKQGWDELVVKLLEWFETVEDIGAESAIRLAADEGEDTNNEAGMPVMIALLGFEMPTA